jgi:hypothetical protein
MRGIRMESEARGTKVAFQNFPWFLSSTVNGSVDQKLFFQVFYFVDDI